MSERSIAEIIGWKRTDLGHWQIPSEASISHLNRKPTVDDLLVWLADHDWFPYELYPDPSFALEAFDVYLRHISVPWADEATCDAWSKQFIQVGGRTLLAALESAVRAVDQQSSSLASGSPEAEVEAAPSPTAPTSQSGSL